MIRRPESRDSRPEAPVANGFRRAHGGAALALALCASAASAQQLPPAAEPGRVQQEVQEPREPEPAPFDVSVDAPERSIPADAEAVRFLLTDIELPGSTLYAPSELRAAFARLLGTEISLADLHSAAREITAKYRNDGYILSQAYVPAQTISNGVARIEIIEGYIADVRLSGELRGRRGLIERLAGRIVASRPLHSRHLERYLLLMNDLPGVVARGTIVASRSFPGASDLVVDFSHDFADFDVDLSNRGSEYLGPERGTLSLSLNSIFRGYETTTLQYMEAADENELEFASISHSQLLTAGGLKLTLSASSVDAVPGLGAEFEAFNFGTDSRTASLRLDYPISRTRARNLSYFVRLTRYDGETSSDFFSERSDETISAFRTGVSLDVVDRMRGVNVVEVEWSQGIDAFDASSASSPTLSRPGGNPEFSKLTVYAARLQAIGRRWSILTAISAQSSFDNLLAPEEFAFGGEYFGRAYDPAELVGDDGAALKLEVRYTWQAPGGSGLTLYGFSDVGEVKQELGPGEVRTKDSDSAASAGIGLRFGTGRSFSGYVEAAAPLTQAVAAEGNDDTRVFGGLRVRF